MAASGVEWGGFGACSSWHVAARAVWQRCVAAIHLHAPSWAAWHPLTIFLSSLGRGASAMTPPLGCGALVSHGGHCCQSNFSYLAVQASEMAARGWLCEWVVGLRHQWGWVGAAGAGGERPASGWPAPAGRGWPAPCFVLAAPHHRTPRNPAPPRPPPPAASPPHVPLPCRQPPAPQPPPHCVASKVHTVPLRSTTDALPAYWIMRGAVRAAAAHRGARVKGWAGGGVGGCRVRGARVGGRVHTRCASDRAGMRAAPGAPPARSC